MLELIRKINRQDIDEREIENIVKLFKERNVQVYDSHFGISYRADLILIKDDGSYMVTVVDMLGGIYFLDTKDGVLTVDNARGYGSRKGNKVEGWGYDRGRTIAYGYKPTGRYAEKAS